MKKFVIITGSLLLFFGIGYAGIRGLTNKIYHSCTCERFNIDNIETRAHFNIPKIDSGNCEYNEQALVKTNVFYLSLNQNMVNYAKKNGFEQGSDSTFINRGAEEDHSWEARLNSKTGRLDVVMTYINL